MSLRDTLVEWWTLAKAESRASAMNDEQRRHVADALEDARASRRAADVLHAHGAGARALGESRRAYETLAKLECEGDAGTARDAALEASRSEASKQSTDLDAAHPSALGELKKEHEQLFRALGSAHEAIEDALAPFARTPREIRTLRSARRLVVLLAAMGVVGITWFAMRPRVTLRASGWLAHHGPERAMDLKADTGWLLPSGKKGWLELHLSSPRPVSRVRLCTAMGADAAREIEVEVFSEGVVVKKISATLASAGQNYPEWTTLDVDAARVDGVKLSVLGWYGSGGGIGEIELQ